MRQSEAPGRDPERGDRPLVIVGPTASGKSALAMEAAREIGAAEIVSVDSMQVYEGMGVGTAAPTPAEQAEVPHHMVGIIDPADEFTAAEFQAAAAAALEGIRGRGCTPILVGGSGLYVRAVVDGFNIPGRYPDVRARLESESDTTALHSRLSELDPVAAARMQPTNRRRVLRALEVTLGSGAAFSSYGPGVGHYPPSSFTMVGLRWPMSALDDRISIRLRRQVGDGFLEEVRALAGGRPLSRTASQALGYRELLAHLDGGTGLEEALERIAVRTRRLARRQMRWFRGDPRVVWLDAPATAADALAAWDAALAPG